MSGPWDDLLADTREWQAEAIREILAERRQLAEVVVCEDEYVRTMQADRGVQVRGVESDVLALARRILEEEK